jgi:uncharacterized protein (TIGR02285 family)
MNRPATRRDVFFAILIWIVVFFSLSKSANAHQQITWAMYDLAPSYIVRGTPTVDTLGDGIADRLLGMLIKALPEYDHQIALMTMPRILLEMQADKPVCSVNVLRSPERERVAYFTPLLLTPAPQLILSVHLLKQHPEWKNGVSLATLVNDKVLKGQYLAGRSFGDKLDGIIQSSSNVSMKSNSGATGSNALKMISIGRADYTIEYPELLTVLLRNGEELGNLTAIPILDTNQFVEGYVMCSRNSAGLDVIRRIDAILKEHAASREYQLALENWLQPDEARRHRRDYAHFYKTRASTLYCETDCGK